MNKLSNQEFLNAVANDKELHNLLHTPVNGEEATSLETLACLGNSVDIDGYDYPAHTLGTLAVLNILKHPFLSYK